MVYAGDYFKSGKSKEEKRVRTTALIFDFGGVISKTLFETHADTEQALGLASGTLTWQGPFAPESDRLWQKMQREEISERDYWLTRSKEVGALLGEDWQDVQSLVVRSRSAEPARAIRPEAIALINEAKAMGLQLAILSNEMEMFYGPLFRERLLLLKDFDVIVDATHTGILKPDPRAYGLCLRELQALPQHCIFIDDQLKNIRGGLAVGLQCVHFDVRQPAQSFNEVRRLLQQS
jgi:putative hydrolase of the HAD superfamily